MSSKSKKRTPEASLNKAVSLSMVVFVWAWVSCFNPNQDDLERLSKEIRNVRESIATQRVSLLDIKKQLKDEFNVELE